MFRCFWIVGVIAVIAKGEFPGNNCTLESGSHGQCVLFSQCQSAIQNVRKGIRPQHCGFQGNEPIVCCTQENNSELEVSKSRQKCDEYKELAKIPPPPGIVNGLPADAGEFPHIVALGFGEKENDVKWLCGGSLISEKYVLTAAHCVTSSDFGPVKWARLGTINLEEPFRGGYPQDFEIINRLPHPSYRPPATYNDIALLEMNQTILPSQYVHPACINIDLNTPSKAQAIGWGRIGYTAESSNNLMKVDLELYPTDICNKSYSNLSKRALARGIDGASQICAGGSLNESKDTCQFVQEIESQCKDNMNQQGLDSTAGLLMGVCDFVLDEGDVTLAVDNPCKGDSGGPLHVPIDLESNIKTYSIIGVTSFGKACGVANIPGVYTRVSNFTQWIENILWP